MYVRKQLFQFRNASTNTVKAYDTKGLEVTINNKTCILPVWNNTGKRVSISTLNQYGWKLEYLPEQSEAYDIYSRCTYMYQVNVDLKSKVIAMKEVYDDAGLNYDASMTTMENRILELGNVLSWQTRFSETAEALAIVLKQAYRRYLIDIEKDDDANPVGTWSLYQELPYLIRWMPGNYNLTDIPSYKDPVEVDNENLFTYYNGSPN